MRREVDPGNLGKFYGILQDVVAGCEQVATDLRLPEGTRMKAVNEVGEVGDIRDGTARFVLGRTGPLRTTTQKA